MNKKQFKHIALIGKYQSQSSIKLLTSIGGLLKQLGFQASIETQSAVDAQLTDQIPTLGLAEIGQQCDLVIVVGGDGTMLRAAHHMANYNVPLVGINQGRLGFITDIAPDDYEASIKEILSGDFTEDTRDIIQAEVWRQGEKIHASLALNEVVINRGSTSNMVEVGVEFDGNFVANLRADGVIISTPTGSTAYALSAHGPILSPSIKGWVMVPIAPHTLSNRPIVLPNHGTISIKILGGREASANFDNHSLEKLKHHDEIIITKAPQKTRFLHPENWSYYETLRHKLRWYAE